MTLEKIITKSNIYAAPKADCNISKSEEYHKKYDPNSNRNSFIKAFAGITIVYPLLITSLKEIDAIGLLKEGDNFINSVICIGVSVPFAIISQTIVYSIISKLYDKIQIARYKNNSSEIKKNKQ